MNEILFLFQTTLLYSTPLIFAGLGGVISERSGIINIGLEGLMVIGAFSASLVAISTHNPWLGFMAGGFLGAILALVHAFFSIHLKANQVISGIAINFLGGGFALYGCRIFFDGASMTPPLDLDYKLPLIFGQYSSVYLAFLATIILWIILNKTIFGLRLKSCGEFPNASVAAGLSVKKYQYIAVISSGFLAGLGGASLTLAIVSNFRPTLISGQGFIALAAMIFGGWKPVQTLMACLFFGFSQALVIFLGGLDTKYLSPQIISMLPYILTLLILMFLSKKIKAPDH